MGTGHRRLQLRRTQQRQPHCRLSSRSSASLQGDVELQQRIKRKRGKRERERRYDKLAELWRRERKTLEWVGGRL
ncbi:hypothetical protein TIFTF001_041949 [Ficus carica]|uniref:Uncharacterized protein n=1 Tax=Ficus carica TaxID=3494 RepID=A0AA87ZCM5_FICCA|nr:hypothetical protein TIFTF001_041949 [Ficus carica]